MLTIEPCKTRGGSQLKVRSTRQTDQPRGMVT